MLSTGCAELPDVEYVTDRIELGVDFDTTVCQGTLDELDAQVERIEHELGRTADPRPIRVYWLEDGPDAFCDEGRSGCYFPATRVLFAKSSSLDHELLHAVVDSEGESYFVEEGLAELLSGVGVVYNMSDAKVSPSERLRLSRSEYREGGLDYGAAAHFMHYVFRSGGTKAVRQLGLEIAKDPSPRRLEQVLEKTLGGTMAGIEADYAAEAPRYYAGLAHGRLPEVDLVDLMAGVAEVGLGWDRADTSGPWIEGDAAMYRVFRLNVPAQFVVKVGVESDGDSRVHIFNPLAQLHRARLTDWLRPDPAIDDKAVMIPAGATEYVELEVGTYLLVVASDDTASVDTQIRMTRTPLPVNP